MKLWVVAVVVVLAVASSVQAQFRFPQLPSPPEIIFGAFRPIFQPLLRSRPRQPRPVRPFPAFGPQNQRPPPPPPRPPPPQPPPQAFQPSPPQFSLQPPPQQVFQLQPVQPQPRPQQPVFQPPQQSKPPSRPQQFVKSPPDLSSFGAPRPESILNGPPTPKGPPRARPNPPPRPNPPKTFSPSQPFPQPIPDLSDNNIIGMTPPPPPKPSPPPPPPPRARPQPTSQRPRPPQPPPPPPPRATPAPPKQRPVTSPKGNDIDGLLVNPVPSVNAGVLPLANERPEQPQLFPPLVGVS